ncbi:PAS-domain containing protein [Bradyrhizobium iriomotense]|uniref:PAS-domain containing protein n=1 Tax=Bradyrhizobium iriomotense TaxID=441950 RepID=UPI003D677784
MRSQMLALRAALDHVPTGIVLLDAQLRARLINRSFREMWRLPDEVADSNPSILTLLYHGRDTGGLRSAGPRARCARRNARPSGRGRRSHADRSAPNQRRRRARAVHAVAGRWANADLHACHRYRALLR